VVIEIGLTIFILWLWFGGAKAMFQLWQIYDKRTEERASLREFMVDVSLDPINYLAVRSITHVKIGGKWYPREHIKARAWAKKEMDKKKNRKRDRRYR